MNDDSFKSKHNLLFESRPWKSSGWPLPGEFFQFRVGTIHGLWQSTEHSYDILAIDNDQPGNGHFEDVMQYFVRSCQRDHKDLRFLEVMNDRFKKHLINVRGFKKESKTNNVIKRYKYL